MKIIAISDIHGNLIDIPECDLLIIAGDICPLYNHTIDYQLGWLETNFKYWLNKIPAKEVVIIFGNHDFVAEGKMPEIIKIGLRCKILNESYENVCGLKIWGSPSSKYFGGWAFNYYENDLSKIYSKIPEDADIIVVHGPPLGFGDLTREGDSVGSKALLNRIKDFKNKIFIFGHVHEGYGEYTDENSNKLYNVSVLDRAYKLANNVTEIKC